MERTYLQWNLENWITVLLMGAIGMAAVGFFMSGFRAWKSGTPTMLSDGG